MNVNMFFPSILILNLLGVSLAPCHDSCTSNSATIDTEIRTTYALMADGRLRTGVELDGTITLARHINHMLPIYISGHGLVPLDSHASTIDSDGGLGIRIIIVGGRTNDAETINTTYTYDLHLLKIN